MMRLTVIGNPQSRRVELLRRAAVARSVPLVIVPWEHLLLGEIDLREIVRTGDVVRIESPDRRFSVEKLLLRTGLDATQTAATTVASPTHQQLKELPDERGRIRWPAVWYRGFCAALERIEQQLRERPRHQIMNAPADIRVMFDKTATHARLAAQRIPVAPAIGRVANFDELMSAMKQRRWSRAFVKLACGSSASGSIALRIGDRRVQAFTTVEIDGNDQFGQRLFNTRRIRLLESWAEIHKVVDAICAHEAHGEYWLPKAGINGQTFDLRVVVIARKACHCVARLSRKPMTNLHLLNDRADGCIVRDRCGKAHWDAAMESCQRAMQVFAGSLYAGLDLLISPDFKKHAILEANAFGDLLVGATWQGMDCYEAELAALAGRPMEAQVA